MDTSKTMDRGITFRAALDEIKKKLDEANGEIGSHDDVSVILSDFSDGFDPDDYEQEDGPHGYVPTASEMEDVASALEMLAGAAKYAAERYANASDLLQEIEDEWDEEPAEDEGDEDE